LRITSRSATLGGLALITTSAMLLAGCAAAPEEGPGDTGAASDFVPCMVSDAGGFDDKSFNQLGFEGINQAADELGVEAITVESNSETDYAPNIQTLVDEGCGLIVTVGFALSAATVEAAIANPDINFIIIDDAADNDFDGTTDAPNIKPVVFDTAQAAYLAGYLSAGVSTTAKIGTFGGMNFPTVSLSTTTRSTAPALRSSAGTVLTAPSPAASLPAPRPRPRLRLSSTRTSTCSCPSVARSTRARLQQSATPVVRSPCSVLTPTCTTPTRRSATCC